MAGLEGRVQMVKGLHQFTVQAKKQLMLDVEEAALDSAVAGEWTMRDVISSYPSAFVSGKNNRIWTGTMYRAADSKVERKGTKVEVSVGWVQYKQPYFLLQEKLPPKDGSGPGMHSLVAAQERVKSELFKKGIK